MIAFKKFLIVSVPILAAFKVYSFSDYLLNNFISFICLYNSYFSPFLSDSRIYSLEYTLFNIILISFNVCSNFLSVSNINHSSVDDIAGYGGTF
jgi:hypothetical protein